MKPSAHIATVSQINSNGIKLRVVEISHTAVWKRSTARRENTDKSMSLMNDKICVKTKWTFANRTFLKQPTINLHLFLCFIAKSTIITNSEYSVEDLINILSNFVFWKWNCVPYCLELSKIGRKNFLREWAVFIFEMRFLKLVWLINGLIDCLMKNRLHWSDCDQWAVEIVNAKARSFQPVTCNA